MNDIANRARRIVMLSAAILLPLIGIFIHYLFMGAGPEGARTTYTIGDFDGESLFMIVRVFLIALVPIAVVVGVFWWFDRRSKIILRNWAAKNEFQITQLKQRYMFATGPFKWWTNSRNQIIYFVTVRDSGGLERSGWVRCGSYYNGLFGNDDNVEVSWEKISPTNVSGQA